MKLLLEIAVDTHAGAQTAYAAGADRIELCAALSEGGITPSAGQMQQAAKLPIPVFAMIRPRGGNFDYSAAEAKVMQHDIEMARQSGMAGLVFGALRPNNTLNTDFLADLFGFCGGLPVTLHRAFDLVTDQFAALEQAIELGFTRILTSGGATDAAAGCDRLAQLVNQAKSRISILPGAGIRARNAATILAKTGAKELHAACRIGKSANDRLVAFGFTGGDKDLQTDRSAIADLKECMNRFQTVQVPA